jgi:hypothetical protein
MNQAKTVIGCRAELLTGEGSSSCSMTLFSTGNRDRRGTWSRGQTSGIGLTIDSQPIVVRSAHRQQAITITGGYEATKCRVWRGYDLAAFWSSW